MTRKTQTRLVLYCLIPCLIMGWWFLSFQINKPFLFNHTQNIAKESNRDNAQFPFVPIERTLLHRALQGDFALMARLIADWDVEAQILESQGFEMIQRLTASSFLRSQLIVRERKGLERPDFIIDDIGNRFDLNHHFNRFLPQTHVAASFLLALTQPEQIAALPQGMRDQTHLYPYDRIKKIPLDINRYNAEKLYLMKPDIAFVAHYSHPATLQALEQQGVKLFTIKNIETVEDITGAISDIGNLINRNTEAELLKLFIEASFMAIDNQLATLKQKDSHHHSKKNLLYLNYYSQFSVPNPKTLTGQLMQRLGINPLINETVNIDVQDQWKVPIVQEQIVNLNPDALIISTTQAGAMKQFILSNPAFRNLSAIRKNQLYFVDEIVQESPSQYIVLAYYDLFQILQQMSQEEQTLFVEARSSL